MSERLSMDKLRQLLEGARDAYGPWVYVQQVRNELVDYLLDHEQEMLARLGENEPRATMTDGATLDRVGYPRGTA